MGISYLEINHATGTSLDTIKNALPIYLDALMKSSQDDTIILWQILS
jgi:hypothetical protein